MKPLRQNGGSTWRGRAAKPIKIGVSMLFDDLWLTTLRDAMTAVAASEPGVELVMVDSKEDVATQLGQVENFVTQGLDAIVLVAANTDATDPMTKAAVDAGIPLVYVNRKPSNLPEGVVYAGSDSIDAGRFQARMACRTVGRQGQLRHHEWQSHAGSRPEAHRRRQGNFRQVSRTSRSSRKTPATGAAPRALP